MKREFRRSLEVFLEVCREKNIQPSREYSGRFNLRIPPGLHSEIAVRAAVDNKRINQWVADALSGSLED